MPRSPREAEIAALLRQLCELEPREELEVDELSLLVAQRQGIIDRLSTIDGSLALLREAIGGSPQLGELLDRALELDRQLLALASARHQLLHDALSKTGQGLRASRGYRLQLQRSPAIIDKQA